MNEKSGYTWKNLEETVAALPDYKNRLDGAKIVIFGMGMMGSFAYERMKVNYQIYAFSDNNEKFWQGTHKGLPVIEPEQLKEMQDIIVVIAVTGQHYPAIKRQLEKMNVEHMTYAEYILKREMEMFRTVYFELLEDDCSRKTYVNLLMSHLTCDMSLLRDVFTREQYFALPDFCLSCTDEVFVDCGAYVGDTLEHFITNCGGIFKRTYSFEPTKKTYDAMCIRKERLLSEWALEEGQIVTEQKIVGMDEGECGFIEEKQGGKANRVTESEEESSATIKSVALDAYFANKGDKPTFIKADIEGAERDMLLGARNIIMAYKPRLAVCIYHRIEDLYEIPMQCHEMNPAYKMAIRQHMPNYHETVLYCWE